MYSRKVICKYPWTHFEVNNPNGNVTMCCDSIQILGNVNQNSILEIWNGKEYQKIRKEMLLKGAHSVCSSHCAVLKGFKSYQNLDWYCGVDNNSILFQNADNNEKEIQTKAVSLESKPRWMRFAYSHVCNLNCYHCYQEKTRRQNLSLPDKFIKEVYEFADYYQVMFFFGGEPFLYKPTIELLKSGKLNPWCRYFFVTNATLLNDELFSILENREIGLLACSIDGASENTYQKLRKGGSWDKVLMNLQRISSMKSKKNFVFSIALTINSINAGELENFCALALSLNAEPLIALVQNPFGTLAFQKKYLHFDNSMLSQILEQIDRSIPQINERGFQDAVIIWEHTKQSLLQHKKDGNNLIKFYIKRKMYDFYCLAPDPIKRLAKKVISSDKTSK
ncbi:MAG: radical SAM protein [Candidatus Xenobiia bacterium LiM19]